MKKPLFYLFLSGMLIMASGANHPIIDDRPNFVIVIGDDATYTDLPLYGGTNITTPNIDKLAEQGLTFDRAFLCEAMCVPCRAELYSGIFPLRNGAAWNHAPARSNMESMVQVLERQGYRVGRAGKPHPAPKSVFDFEEVGGLESSCVSPTAYFSTDGMELFMTRNDNQPFCLVVALVVPHGPWTVGNPGAFKPDEFDLPPYIADTKTSREDFARYLAELKVMDNQVGRVMQLIGKTGKAHNTILMFTSEQGAQWPGCKWTSFNPGVHTAFIVRWPGITQEGKRTNAIIQYADVLPTILDVIGVSPGPDQFDGFSFLDVLTGKSEKHRDYAYFIHNNIPEGTSYPIRGITDGEYHYVRNLKSDELYIEKHVMGKTIHQEYWLSWFWDAPEDEQVYQALKRYMLRPPEQLFNSLEDPFNVVNLADQPEYQDKIKLLSRELDKWLLEQGDPGAAMDSWEYYEAARRDQHIR